MVPVAPLDMHAEGQAEEQWNAEDRKKRDGWGCAAAIFLQMCVFVLSTGCLTCGTLLTVPTTPGTCDAYCAASGTGSQPRRSAYFACPITRMPGSCCVCPGSWHACGDRALQECAACVCGSTTLIAHTGVSAACCAIVRRDQIQGRLHNVVSSLSMVYGLVFSGVAGSALSPLKAVDYEEDTYHRTLANL